MGDEREPAAWQVLPSGSRAVLAVIEEIARQGTARISKRNFVAYGIGPGQIAASVRRLENLSFITVRRGSFGSRPISSVFRLSEGWRSIGEADAKRLARVSRKSRSIRAKKRDAESAARRRRRRHFGNDHLSQRLREGARARPDRS
jgi:DNA-binding PadR family transcriptional regulator